jgi:hypothetical protein
VPESKYQPQLTGGFSLMAGHTYGRVIGIIAGSLGAIGALLSVGGNHPWWSLGVFALCVIVVHGIVVYGEEDRVAGTDVTLAGSLRRRDPHPARTGISPVRINAVTLMSTSGSDWQRFAPPAAGIRDATESFASFALLGQSGRFWPKPL